MKKQFINIFQYENWANKVITDSLLKINEPPEKIMMLMSHIINAQILWLERIKKVPQSVGVWHVYSKSELNEALDRSASSLIEFLNRISENNIEDLVEYTNTKSEIFNSTVRDILTHLSHHSSYHRGQTILLMKPLVSDLPYTDYIHFARNIRNS
ncbi:MAG: damage-inducible protein DinB [Bacteroidota bacterium]|nr:damage-inducible protein DinB [Bacteroidota bacterium]